MVSLACILLPHLDYEAFPDLKSVNHFFNFNYQSLKEAVIPDGLQVQVKIICAEANAEFFLSFLQMLKQDNPALDGQIFLLPPDQASIGQGFIQAVQNTQDDYLWFFPAGSQIDRNFFVELLPGMKQNFDFIKSAVMSSRCDMVQDALYESAVSIDPLLLCKDFGSLICKRTYLLEHDFIARMSHMGVDDLGLCGCVVDMLRNDPKVLEGQSHNQVHISELDTLNQKLQAQAQSEQSQSQTQSEPSQAQPEQLEQVQSETNSTSERFKRGRNSLVRLQRATAENFQYTKPFQVVRYLPRAKIVLHEAKLTQPSQVNQLFQFATYFFRIFKPSLRMVALILVLLLDKVRCCETSALKRMVVAETYRMYESLVQEQQRGAISNEQFQQIERMLDFFSHQKLAQAFKEQDEVALLSVVFLREQVSADVRIKELWQDHESNLIIRHSLEEQLAQDRMGAWPHCDCSLPKSAKDHAAIAGQEQAASGGATGLEHGADTANTVNTANADNNANVADVEQQVPGEHAAYASKPALAAYADASEVHVIPVVNNQPLFEQLFERNPCLAQPGVFLHPRMNPGEDGKIKGLPEIFNQFIEEFCADPTQADGWLVFCHNDFEILSDLQRALAHLNPQRIYGPCGAFVRMKNNLPTFGYVGYSLAANPDKDVVLSGNQQALFRGFPKEREKYVVDTFDCMCLIVHSSLIKQLHLRFDEHLRFDLVIEDFCLNAAQQGVKSQLANVLSIHHSSASALNLPPSYYPSLKYLNAKYPKLVAAGTCSLIGGAVPPEQYFVY